jgi:hypothetical protein
MAKCRNEEQTAIARGDIRDFVKSNSTMDASHDGHESTGKKLVNLRERRSGAPELNISKGPSYV